MAYIEGLANVKCSKCNNKHNEMDRHRVIDIEATKKWCVTTHKIVCPECGHDEYFKLDNY